LNDLLNFIPEKAGGFLNKFEENPLPEFFPDTSPPFVAHLSFIISAHLSSIDY